MTTLTNGADVKRRAFIKTAGLGLLAIPAFAYGQACPDKRFQLVDGYRRYRAAQETLSRRNKWLIQFGYTRGWCQSIWIWHGDKNQPKPELGLMVNFGGIVYTVIEIKPFTKSLVSSILLDRPLEKDIHNNELGQVSSFCSSNIWYGCMDKERIQ